MPASEDTPPIKTGQSDTIPITVDKSHLVTIGERLYSESVELIRELVNNAYDADAREVHVTLSSDKVSVEDDGAGMDRHGLKQYFTIGSPFKKTQRKSPVFQRDRIGEFGIGKFSSLAACRLFKIFTKKGDFAATVTFDKDEWNKSGEHWHLPLRVETPAPDQRDGTCVTLLELNKTFELGTVERRLQESVPLKAPDFAVFLNGRKIHPKYLAGRRIPFMEGTQFGVVHGEVVVSPGSCADRDLSGIECKVRQVTVKKDFFGLRELIGEDAERISGEIHADFLLISSDRSGFIQDSPEYRAFAEVMKRIIERLTRELSSLKDEKENRRVSRSLKAVISKIQDALFKNRDWCPAGFLPLENSRAEKPPVSGARQTEAAGQAQTPEEPRRKTRVGKLKLKQLSPSALVKKLKLGRHGLALIMDHFGAESPESFTEGEIIHLNRDHPLFIREAAHKERHVMHISRLISQEIALMSHPKNPRQAFERQSKLLKDAFSVRPPDNNPGN